MPFIILCFLLFTSSSFATPPAIQLATKFHSDIDISAYFVSEKLDGVRAYWDGQHLISRQGNIFPAPKWFYQAFPDTHLDGELWIARGKFELVSGIARNHSDNKQAWKQVRFMIFDLPRSTAMFAERVNMMKQIIKTNKSPYLNMIEQRKIATHNALQLALDRVIKDGGEGLMLHHIDAYYQVKRSQDLMKLKRHDDAEATVLATIPGKGKHLGRMGALVVETENGIVFKIGTGFSDIERENPPQIGDIITFKYIGKTKNGIPRFASYLRIRHPISH